MKKLTFQFNGHSCTLLCPEIPCGERRWVWRAEFLGAFDYADMALLNMGWHIAYCDLQNQYGCDYAVEEMKGFHSLLVSDYGLSPKADIFGFSRGGLYTFNYAVKYPEDLRTVYLDAPVLSIKSWPGGFGRADRYETEWQECMECYGLNEASAEIFRKSPVDRLGEFMAVAIPTIIVAGDSDEVVPFEENGKLLAAVLENSEIIHKIIMKPNVGHHPHSLENPKEIVDFIAQI